MKINKSLAVALATLVGLGSVPVHAQEPNAVVSRAQIENAVAEHVQSDAASREAIQTLLSRADVREMASGMGLDVRRAQNAVSSLQGTELRQVANQATAADALLSGGTTTVRISLVAVLLIVIIVILLAN